MSAKIDEPALRQWACKQLQLNTDTQLERAALLRRLAAEEWCPTPAVDYALRVLDGKAQTTPADEGRQQALLALEAELAAEIEAFVKDFFTIAVTLRRQRWQELRTRAAAFPRLSARVEELQAGLILEPATLRAAEPAVLASVLIKLFKLPPGERAAYRSAKLAELARDREHWAAHAASLQQRLPALVALDRTLIDELRDWQLHEQRAARAAAERRKGPPSSGSGGSAGAWTGVSVAVAVVIIIIRAIVSTSTRPEPPRGYTPPSFQQQPLHNQAALEQLLRERKFTMPSTMLLHKEILQGVKAREHRFIIARMARLKGAQDTFGWEVVEDKVRIPNRDGGGFTETPIPRDILEEAARLSRPLLPLSTRKAGTAPLPTTER